MYGNLELFGLVGFKHFQNIFFRRHAEKNNFLLRKVTEHFEEKFPKIYLKF
jgi:hypothetical protein